MKTITKRLVVYLACLGLDVFIAWPMVLAVWVLWGKDLRWEHGVLSTEFKANSWPLRPGRWPKGFYIANRGHALVGTQERRSWGGTSVGHGHLYGPGLTHRSPKGKVATPTQVHEGYHTEQARAAQMLATIHALLILAAGGSLWLSLVVWVLGGYMLLVVTSFVIAWLLEDVRGFYKGSMLEVGAYSVGRLYAGRRQPTSTYSPTGKPDDGRQ